MWLAHHHEYALLAALCNILSSFSFSEKIQRQATHQGKNFDGEGEGEGERKEEMAKEKSS